MRFLIAGLVCLAIGISLTEYTRRNPPGATASSTTDDGAKTDDAAKKPKWPKAVATLLELDAAGTDTPGNSPELAALLTVPTDAPIAGYAPTVGGAFVAHHLSGGFGAALFAMESGGKSALVRVASGEPAKLLFSRNAPITALDVDGSTVFFAEGGLVGATLARGGEGITVRARFKNATVTSLSASGDTLVMTVLPKGTDPASTDAVGAVVSLSGSGELSLIASELVRPRGAQTDGKDAWWLAGSPSALWRGALDGAFTSQLADLADEPLVLEGDALYYRAPLGTGVEVKRIGRAGGGLQTIITADVSQLAVSSGFIRVATQGAGAALLEVIAGSDATKVLDLPATARGLAIGGTTVFLLTQGDDGRSVVWAK